MKISLNWLKNYISLTESAEKIGQRLTDTGLEVESINTFETVKGGLEGVVIGEVITCVPHPNADKLKLTTVDIGESESSQIVCGAPNVAAGQKVVVATVNTTLYPFDDDPFTIKKAKIRGESSQGMICAEDEIGMGQSHAGIMVLDTDVPNGTPAANYFKLENDYVFEIGLTPNRVDATSHIGTARDLKAVLNKPVLWPEVESFKVDNHELPIEVIVKNHEACPRYSGVSITNLKVGPSPDWLKNRLLAIGLSPINNVVDITNFVLHEVGQPLHAFDAKKITGNRIIVKTANKGQKFTTLDEKERTLTDKDLMICDGNESGMCIAGVFGGINSGVTEETTSIFLESAYFSADYIRKTAQHHQLKTDASFRYERGTDPEITLYALKRAALLMKEIAGGTISSEIIDIYPNKIAPVQLELRYKNVDKLIGQVIPKDEVKSILTSLDFIIEDETESSIVLAVPTYRVDVTREADVIEEILRIIGFNTIEIPNHFGTEYLAEFPKIDSNKLQYQVSTSLVSRGFYEIITNSLTKPVYAINDSSINEKLDVEILNKLSEDLGVMRQSLLYSMLEVAQHNINRKQTDLKLFEHGKTYFKKENGYGEKRHLAILMTGNTSSEHWSKPSNGVSFHDLSGVVYPLIRQFTNKEISSQEVPGEPYQYVLSYKINNKDLATVGKIANKFLKALGIKQDVFYADIDWKYLIKLADEPIFFNEVSKFPEVRRDLSLVLDKSVSYEQVLKLAEKKERNLLKSINVFDVYEGDKIDKNQKAYALSFTLQDTHKTLTDKVIDKTMERLMKAFESELGAIIRK